ncbi:MAG: GldG family protein [Anaerolineae bacterium]|nr:GldG family protein [Anaerolineae bacterium]
MTLDSRRKEKIGNVLLILAALAVLVALGFLLVERHFSLGSEIAFGIAAVLLVAFVFVEPLRTRKWVTGRQARYGSNAVLMSVVLLVVLAVGNYLADAHPYRVDVTANRRLSLSQETVDVLDALEGPVRVVGFFPSTAYPDQAQDLLSQYEYHYADWESTFYDPVVEPSRASEWGVTDTWRATVFIIYQERQDVIHTVSEREVTSALVRLSRAEQPVVYFLTGHGEPDLADTQDAGLSTLSERLVNVGFEVASLNLLITETVPSDASAVVLLSPITPLAQDELDRLAAYLDGGGAGMVLLDPLPNPEDDSAALLAWLAERWGVQVRNDIVLDGTSYLYPMPTVPLVSAYGVGPIGDGMGTVETYFIEARSIQDLDPDAGPNYVPVVQTSANSWGESSWEELSQYPERLPEFDEGEDVGGPVDIGVALEDRDSDSRLVLFGDAHFCMNIAVQDAGNSDLFVNALNWLTEDEELISISPKVDEDRYVVIRSALVRNALFAILVLLIPLTVAGLGVLVFVVRRVRRPK